MNAIDTVRLIQEATERTARWPKAVRETVLAAMPQHVHDLGYTPLEWMTTVEVFRQPQEALVIAARRLSLYMLAHAERWHATPTLARVQKDALARKVHA